MIEVVMAAALTLAIQSTSHVQNQQSRRGWMAKESTFAEEGLRGRIFDLVLRDGRHQRVLYSSPAKPVAVVVMFPGGSGDIGLRENGRIDYRDNFVVRTRLLWVKRGYAVCVSDAIDHANLRGERSSAQYAAVILELIEFVRSQAPAPVFLLGTSQGSIAAMNGAAHISSGLIAGVVLTESVSRLGGSGETVFSASPENVRVPALVVANRADRCVVATPEAAPQIAAAMSNSPSVRVVFVNGGKVGSTSACGSLTPHGYFGIETPVVDLIVRWMNDHG